MTRLWLVDQKLYIPKLSEEDIYQSTGEKIPKIAKCKKNGVIDSFQYMQKHYMFFH